MCHLETQASEFYCREGEGVFMSAFFASVAISTALEAGGFWRSCLAGIVLQKFRDKKVHNSNQRHYRNMV